MNRTNKLVIILSVMALIVAGCSTIGPSTWANAVRGHQVLPALSVAVMECTAERSDIQDQIRDPFNEIVDLWKEAKDLDPQDALSIGSRIKEAKGAWLRARNPIVDAGLDCGVWVKAEVLNIETTFNEFEEAINANAYAVTALQYADLLASIVGGRRVTVQRM